MAISWDTAEKNLTSWVAAQLQLSTDHSVFRSAFPERFTEGAAVCFEQGKSASQNQLNECDAVVKLRFCERAVLFTHIASLSAALQNSLPQGYCSADSSAVRITLSMEGEAGEPRFQAEIRFPVAFL